MQFQTGSVDFFGNRHISYGAVRGRVPVQLRPSGPRGITVSAEESAIFVEDFRVPEDPGGGGPVDASRGV